MIDFFAGVLIASLAGMGIGGGGLLVLYLVFVKGAEQLGAQGLNLVFFICAAASSVMWAAPPNAISVLIIPMWGWVTACGSNFREFRCRSGLIWRIPS